MIYSDQPNGLTYSGSNVGMAKAYALLAVLIGTTTLGTFYGMAHPGLVTGHYILALVLFFVLGFGSQMAARVSPTFGFVVALGFSLVAGAYIAPEILAYLRMPGGLAILQDALGTTVAASLGISAYALTTRRDFSHLNGFLTAGLVVLIIGLIANLFLHLSALQMALAGIGALLFSALLLVETNRLRDTVDPRQSMMLVLAIYLDIFNLFQFLLELFGGMNRD